MQRIASYLHMAWRARNDQDAGPQDRQSQSRKTACGGAQSNSSHASTCNEFSVARCNANEHAESKDRGPFLSGFMRALVVNRCYRAAPIESRRLSLPALKARRFALSVWRDPALAAEVPRAAIPGGKLPLSVELGGGNGEQSMSELERLKLQRSGARAPRRPGKCSDQRPRAEQNGHAADTDRTRTGHWQAVAGFGGLFDATARLESGAQVRSPALASGLNLRPDRPTSADCQCHTRLTVPQPGEPALHFVSSGDSQAAPPAPIVPRRSDGALAWGNPGLNFVVGDFGSSLPIDPYGTSIPLSRKIES